MANSCNIDNTDSPENKSSVVRFDISCSKTNQCPENKDKTFCMMWCPAFPFVSELKQYIGVITFGILLWGSSWFLFKEDVLPGGYLFEMSALVISGYVCGHTLERYTTLNPVVGMTLTGVLWRNFSSTNFLQHPIADSIDYHLRRIYPVIILTKGPLSWNWQYIKRNPIKVFSLATLPWIVECLSSAVLTHLFLGFSWYWAIHLGAILSSVSPAIVVPTTIALSKKGLGLKNQIALLVANAGGLDTAFTEGMFGVINSAIFYSSPLVYRIIKALLAIFVGIGLGVVWAIFLDFVPDHKDIYAPTIRSLLIFAGGLFITYVGGYYGWGGTSGVAIMVCAGAAATRWDRRDWPINNNPVSEVYKLLWRIFEPMLFTLSGYFLEVSQITAREFGLIVACIFSALFIRMLAAFLIALANRLTVKESIFIAITWMPKAIVEKCSGLQTRIKTKFRSSFADQIMLLLILLHIDFGTSVRAVLVRVATDSLWSDGTTQDRWIASQHANIIVIAILLTSTLGSILTTTLGPILLSREIRVSPAEEPQTIYPYQPTAPEQTKF